MLSRWSLLLFGLVALAGAAVACEGLSPGDQIEMNGSLCTLGFLVADPSGLYFSTAGHCVNVNDTVSSPDVGEWGTGAHHFLEPEGGALPMQGGAPGMDFALIRVAPEFYAALNPKVCGWDGPTGVYEGAGEGAGVRHYGHGVVLGVTPTTRAREGFFLRTNEQAFYWTGFGVSGDSGSAVLSEDNLAIGVFTHGQYGATTEDNGGTRLQRGFELAAEAGFSNLRLVLMGEDPVAVLAEMKSPNVSEAAAPPASPNTPAKPSSASSNSTAPPASQGSTSPPRGSVNDSIAPAAVKETGPATKDTPFPGVVAVLAPALAVALALRPRRRL